MSLVAESKNIDVLFNCNIICNNMGLKDYSVKYMGALDILITFKTREMAEDIMSNKKDIWSTYFWNLFWWNEDYTPTERLAWLIIRGVPPHLRD